MHIVKYTAGASPSLILPRRGRQDARDDSAYKKFHVKHDQLTVTISPVLDYHTDGDIIRYCFEISPLLSNIELDYSAQSSRTNPIGRNDVYC